MNKREQVIKVDGAGVGNDAGFILVYDCGDRVSLVASAEKNGDAEVILDKTATAALAEALRKLSLARRESVLSIAGGARC